LLIVPPRRPNEISAGGVVVRRARTGWQVALVRAGRHWSLPKGGIEPGESPAQAALREVAEECGLPLESLQLRDQLPGSDYVYRRESRLIFKHVDHFLIEAEAEASLRPQAGEIDEAEWLDFSTAITRASFKDTRVALTRAQELLAGS
jgi:8-oxo-dGTP pyrophosphatase MutT (NUDIX family)